MAKVPAYSLAWSSARENNKLYETRDREALRIVPESAAWFAQLDQVSSFPFSGKRGHYTTRKEAKQCGDRYWYNYLATGKRLTKKYLGKSSYSPFPPGPLFDPLTERERVVLWLLLAGASNREIARRLVVNVNTVKRHVYNLCGKQGVQSCMQALARARTLNLL
jgi:DNA-binding CsgD family transcriptional regulator